MKGTRMGDHFWPAMYPGLIVGLLYGLSLRGTANAVIGALGGLVGSAIAYWALLTLGMNEGLVSVAGMVALAAIGAFCATNVYARVARANPPSR
jgi:tetrahydromethanopterin S-methyltransferase subunit D